MESQKIRIYKFKINATLTYLVYWVMIIGSDNYLISFLGIFNKNF